MARLEKERIGAGVSPTGAIDARTKSESPHVDRRTESALGLEQRAGLVEKCARLIRGIPFEVMTRESEKREWIRGVYTNRALVFREGTRGITALIRIEPFDHQSQGRIPSGVVAADRTGRRQWRDGRP